MKLDEFIKFEKGNNKVEDQKDTEDKSSECGADKDKDSKKSDKKSDKK